MAYNELLVPDPSNQLVVAALTEVPKVERGWAVLAADGVLPLRDRRGDQAESEYLADCQIANIFPHLNIRLTYDKDLGRFVSERYPQDPAIEPYHGPASYDAIDQALGQAKRVHLLSYGSHLHHGFTDGRGVVPFRYYELPLRLKQGFKIHEFDLWLESSIWGSHIRLQREWDINLRLRRFPRNPGLWLQSKIDDPEVEQWFTALAAQHHQEVVVLQPA